MVNIKVTGFIKNLAGIGIVPSAPADRTTIATGINRTGGHFHQELMPRIQAIMVLIDPVIEQRPVVSPADMDRLFYTRSRCGCLLDFAGR